MAYPFASGFQSPKDRGHSQIIALAHGVQKQGHATAAIGTFAKGVVDLAGRDDGLGIGRAHPVHCSADVMVGNLGAMANDHGLTSDRNYLAFSSDK
jgi:hypothetical protein